MKRHLLLTMISIFLTLSGIAQEIDAIPEISLIEISAENQGNSYITFPTDIGNIEPLWFEGNIVPNFYLRHSKNFRLMGVLTPKVIVRMYHQASDPILTPSYLPQFTLYYLLKGHLNEKKISLFGRYAHHSNGQDGNFYLENGGINLKSGSFSTNYFETGIIAIRKINRFNMYQFFKSSIEIHPKSWSNIELEGIYSKYRWHNAFSIFHLKTESNQDTRKKPAHSIKGETTCMFGEYSNLNSFSLNRLNLSFTYFYHPKFLEDIGLFVQFYYGSDYYNIYFNRRLDLLRFGIMTEKLRF